MTKPWIESHGAPGAPLLLCLHGIGSCGSAFAGQAPLAESAGRRVVAWDAPGYRHSPDPESAYRLDDWADAAAQLIIDEGDGSADVLGVSWGGVTATRLVLRHPQLVRSLILADSSTGAGLDPEMAASMRSRAADVESLGLEPFARSRAPRLLAPDAGQALIDEAAQMMIDSVRLPSYQWACDSMAEADHRADLASIDKPTLVIFGDHDIITPPDRSKELASGIRGADLVEVAGAGHLANQEKPSDFNEAVRQFLRSRSNEALT